jgi:glycosyltransferase involved in cell wall biosynthesis
MLFPTYWQGEGFPGAIIDAFVSGVPVIASDWNMNREIIIHEKNGLLVPPGDAMSLALAMKRMIFDGELRIKMGKRSNEFARKYHVDYVFPQLCHIIEE